MRRSRRSPLFRLTTSRCQMVGISSMCLLFLSEWSRWSSPPPASWPRRTSLPSWPLVPFLDDRDDRRKTKAFSAASAASFVVHGWIIPPETTASLAAGASVPRRRITRWEGQWLGGIGPATTTTTTTSSLTTTKGTTAKRRSCGNVLLEATSFSCQQERIRHQRRRGEGGRQYVARVEYGLRKSRIPSFCSTTFTSTTSSTALFLGRRNKKQQSRQDEADLDRWYESVDADASPDDVFREEMERQRLLNEIGSGADEGGSSFPAAAAAAASSSPRQQWPSPLSAGAAASYASSSSSSLSSSYGVGGSTGAAMGGGGGGTSIWRTNSMLGMASASAPGGPGGSPSFASSGGGGGSAVSGRGQQPQQQSRQQSLRQSAEATLSEYAAFAVSDNWLNEELAWMMDTEDDDLEQQAKSLDEQLDEWANEQDGEFDDDVGGAWSMEGDEPWDHWGEPELPEDDRDQGTVALDPENRRRRVKSSNSSALAAQFLYTDDEEDEDSAEARPEEAAREEAEFVARLSEITISSKRLERARRSPKAAAFFSREPDALSGFDRLWVAAVDNVCFKNLVGVFRNYGVQFADNFGDWKDGSLEDCLHYTIEEVASYKARAVYNVTGLPCIAARTSWQIEPIPTNLNTGGGAGGGAGGNRPSPASAVSPRVASGYRFNDVGMHVDYICDAVRPFSEIDRVTRFQTCLCYYDGEMEVYDYGLCDVDLVFANSVRTLVPIAQAMNEMVKTLQLTFGLEEQAWLKKRVNDAARGSSGPGSAGVKLRDRVLKEAKVLPNDIIDVSAFMDSKVDVNLMDECASELAEKFIDTRPTKILTVATTGLVVALPMGKYLQVPVVYARKERNVVMADTYKAVYSSTTLGKNRELLVSKKHIRSNDRVLIVDDFLSGGSSQEALLRIVSEAGAEAVGVAVLLEKVYDSGRQSLSGYDIPVQSMCRVASVRDGVIQLLEEEGFDRMLLKV